VLRIALHISVFPQGHTRPRFRTVIVQWVSSWRVGFHSSQSLGLLILCVRGFAAGLGVKISIRRLVAVEASAAEAAAWMGQPRLIRCCGQRVPPVSLRSRVGMTKCAIATFEGSTFVGIRTSGVGAILLTAVGWGEIMLV
jgi:hypothetical protein